MTERRSKRLRLQRWSSVGILILCVLISLPFTPVIWRKAQITFGMPINLIGSAILAVMAALLVLYMLRNLEKYGIFSFFSLFGILLIYGYLLRYQCKFPAERLHLVVYGLLVFLLYGAFQLDFSNTGSYGFAFIFSAIFGTVDELVQYLLPNRTFEIRDIATNIISSALGLVIVAIVFRTRPRALVGSIHRLNNRH